jgi:L-rhamnose-H+ transport protein
MSSLTIGIILSIIAGIINGSFATPTKYVKVWKWENIWSVWALFGMVIFPWIALFITVPRPMEVYQQGGLRNTLMLVAFGLGFGLAQILFGLGIAAVGMALNFAIAIGISTAFGSLLPLLIQHRDRIFTPQGGWIFLGVFLILIGIVGCAMAGKMKDTHLGSADDRPRESAAIKMSFKAGLVIVVLAGIGSPLINFGLAFGDVLKSVAGTQGVSPGRQANVIWAPLNTAAFIPYILYCIYLWKKNNTARLFNAPGTGRNWLFGAIMGALWFGSTLIYGDITARLGKMGPVLGWPLFMSAIIVASNLWGLATGEWKGAGSKALNAMFGGIFFLILGFAALAYAGRLG